MAVINMFANCCCCLFIGFSLFPFDCYIVNWPANRLNKIGKNPNLMSQKDDEISNPDESAINAVVNALAAVETKEEK